MPLLLVVAIVIVGWFCLAALVVALFHAVTSPPAPRPARATLTLVNGTGGGDHRDAA